MSPIAFESVGRGRFLAITDRPKLGRMNDIAALFHQLTMGVYVIGVSDGSARDAFTAASIAQVSYQPLLLSLAINPQHASYDLLLRGNAWTVSVLGQDQIEWARRFGTEAAEGTDKMQGVRWAAASTGAPYLEQALAYFDCRLVANHPGGDHRLVIGRVADGAILRSGPQAKPLVYADTGDLDRSAPLYPNHFD